MRSDWLLKFGPMSVDHPFVADASADRCAACRQRFRAGDYGTLIKVGPGEYADERQRAREGQAYNAIAVPVHWACATGEEP